MIASQVVDLICGIPAVDRAVDRRQKRGAVPDWRVRSGSEPAARLRAPTTTMGTGRVARDRNGTVEPRSLPKCSRRLKAFNERIVALSGVIHGWSSVGERARMTR